MNDNIVKFYPSDAAKDPDHVLERAMGQYQEVFILGWDKDGFLDARSTQGLVDGGNILWLIESFKHKLLNGDYNID